MKRLLAITLLALASADQAINNDELVRQLQAWQYAVLNSAEPKYWQAPAHGEVPTKPNFPGNPFINPTTSAPYVPPPGNYQPPAGGHYVPAPVPPPSPSPPVSPEVEALRVFCRHPRGQFPSKRCNSYVNCWDDVVIEQECPAGLAFSELGYCDYAFNVDCTHREPKPIPIPPKDNHCPTPFATYRSAKNCSVFYVCSNGIPFRMECALGLYYNTELGVCDYAYNVHCDVPPTYFPQHTYYPPQVLPVTQPPTEVYFPYYTRMPAGAAGCREGAVARLGPDCSSVSVCRAGGTSEVVNCTHGKGYDVAGDRCVPAADARC